MKIGVIGSGDVAKRLAAGYLQLGHTVAIGSRDPTKLADWCNQWPTMQSGTFADVAAQSDLLILAVKGSAALDAMALLPTDSVRGKIVIDTCNPIADAPPVNGVLQFFTGPNDSLMERLQAAYPEVRFVKAFSSVGNACMILPSFASAPTMFICGNDASAKTTVGELLVQAGWEVADCGMVEAARAIEPLCMLWCIPGFLRNDWVHAFKMLQPS